jgi:hypothetical protein
VVIASGRRVSWGETTGAAEDDEADEMVEIAHGVKEIDGRAEWRARIFHHASDLHGSGPHVGPLSRPVKQPLGIFQPVEGFRP